MKLDKYVWISEDGTGIVKKIEYDPSSNQIVGLVLPTNSTTGMPIAFSFLARSASEIEKHVQNTLSSTVYVVLAQPIKENIPPFVLQIFGTDNKFTGKDVHHRWSHIIQECTR